MALYQKCNQMEPEINTEDQTLDSIDPSNLDRHLEYIEMTSMPLIMFIVIRKDLVKTLGWTYGSVMAQGNTFIHIISLNNNKLVMLRLL